MNMPSRSAPEPETIITPTPSGQKSHPRDRRFGREAGYEPRKYWQKWRFRSRKTAFYNCLSATFPRGEAFFIESVKQFSRSHTQKLRRENPRLHPAGSDYSAKIWPLNRRVRGNGYDTSRIEQRIHEIIGQ